MNGFSLDAEKALSSSEGKRLLGKKEELSSLAASDDGMKVKSMLEKADISSAVSHGDSETVKRTIESVLKTEAGARLLAKLRELME